MGGAEILKSVMGKKIIKEQVSFIYEWIDPTLPLFKYRGDFLLSRSKNEFDRRYGIEKEFQEKAQFHGKSVLDVQLEKHKKNQ